MEYVVQPINDSQYKVHKFMQEDDLMPETTYIVKHLKTLVCNCPSGYYRGYCKHTEMVKSFKNKEIKPL